MQVRTSFDFKGIAPRQLTNSRFWYLMIHLSKYEAPSQRSLHNAPIFRLLLKVAVNGTHQCDFLNF